MMARQCGSYPLMNLADELGVDYGDLLLWADNRFYEWLTFHTPPHERYQQAYAARDRMVEVIGRESMRWLERELRPILEKRRTWCNPPQGAQVYA